MKLQPITITNDTREDFSILVTNTLEETEGKFNGKIYGHQTITLFIDNETGHNINFVSEAHKGGCVVIPFQPKDKFELTLTLENERLYCKVDAHTCRKLDLTKDPEPEVSWKYKVPPFLWMCLGSFIMLIIILLITLI